MALPIFAQVAMTAGDRYLAANLGTIRSLVTDTSLMPPDEFAVMARVQVDVSWLNRFHEDNYYSAAAILPWNGQVDAAQVVLERASKARHFDYQPTLFYAFNRLHFHHDAVGASNWLNQAAPKLPDERNRLLMQDLAARWAGKHDDLEVAIRLVESMAKEARREDFRDYLMKRVGRLKALQKLRQAAERYVGRTGHPPDNLRQLLDGGLLDRLPEDPFGEGFAVNRKGIPVVMSEVDR